MPAVDVAMERSLRKGFLDLLAVSLRPALERKDLQGQISDVKTAFSSWDNCMQASFCKWPAIALIIIGGLIIFSVVWCIVRCACCGLSCCCSCFSCLKCCGDCCGCCDPPRGSRRKYLDEPYVPPNHGYKPQEPMHAGFGGPTVPVTKGPDFPQYAVFDAGGKKNEDALPQMPSWDGAENKKVLVEEEAVELDALKKPEAGGQDAGPRTGAVSPATAVSPITSRSPINRSPYGPPGASAASGDYFAPGAAGSDAYAHGAPGYNQPGAAYEESGQGHGMGGTAMGPGRRSPHAYNNGGYYDGSHDGRYGQARDYHARDNYGAAQQQPYDNADNYGSQGQQGYGISRHQSPHELDSTPYLQDSMRSPAPQGQHSAEPRRSPAPYGRDSRRSPAPYGSDPRRSPAPQADYGSGGYPQSARRSPAPQQADYASGYNNRPYSPSRQYSSESAQPLRAPPQRQHSSNSMSPTGSSGPSPLRNDAGFDFTSSGYSRPPGATNGASGYRQPSPTVERQQQGAYPGYKPYQPAA